MWAPIAFPSWALTVDSQVSQSCAGRSLDFNIGALEQEQNGLQCISVDLADIWYQLVSDPGYSHVAAHILLQIPPFPSSV